MEAMKEREQEVLKMLEQDLNQLKAELKETAKAIVEGGYSKFPILVAHMPEIQIAQKVIDRELYQTSYNFSASTLEELVAKGVVPQDKSDSLRNQIGDQPETYCILLVHPDVMRFIFTPLK